MSIKLTELFDSASDLLQNPNYDELTWNDLKSEFEKDGEKHYDIRIVEEKLNILKLQKKRMK